MKTNTDTELRQKVHMAMLKKAEDSDEIQGSYTVVKLGFAVDVALSLIDQYVHQKTIEACISTLKEFKMLADSSMAKEPDMPTSTRFGYIFNHLIAELQASLNTEGEAVEVVSTYSVSKVGEKLYIVNGLDSIKTLDGTVIKMNPNTEGELS